MSTRISPETHAQIVRLWNSGVRSRRKISAATGAHWQTIRRVLRAEGLLETADDMTEVSPQPHTIPVVPSPAFDLSAIVAEVLRQLGGHQAASLARPLRPTVAPAPTGYTTEQKGNVSIVRIEHIGTFEQRFLLSADRHWDNPHSDQAMQRRHMDEALRVGAGIIDVGDLFCAMQGKFDKRASKASVRPEHQVNDYLDALVDTAADFFLPYAKSFIRISPGNHETKIKKYMETDLTARLASKLNERAGSSIHVGGYSGWVMFEFKDGAGRIERKKAWYIHGYGGGGPVTKGVIQTNRRAVYTPDADLSIAGHIHEDWEMPITRTRLDDDGNQYDDEQLHIQLPTYKNEYGDGSGGWHVERGAPPKPLGATWLTFRKETKDGPIEVIRSRAK